MTGYPLLTLQNPQQCKRAEPKPVCRTAYGYMTGNSQMQRLREPTSNSWVKCSIPCRSLFSSAILQCRALWGLSLCEGSATARQTGGSDSGCAAAATPRTAHWKKYTFLNLRQRKPGLAVRERADSLGKHATGNQPPPNARRCSRSICSTTAVRCRYGQSTLSCRQNDNDSERVDSSPLRVGGRLLVLKLCPLHHLLQILHFKKTDRTGSKPKI